METATALAANKNGKLEGKAKFDFNFAPPHDPDLEQNCLADMMLNKKALSRAALELTEADFYASANKKIFAALLYLYEEHGGFEHFRLITYLRETSQLDDVGGAHRLKAILDSAINYSEWQSHFEELAKFGKLRQITGTLIEGLQDVVETRKSPGVIAAQVSETLLNVTLRHNNKWEAATKLIVENIDSKHKALSTTGIVGHRSGFDEIDSYLGGVQPKYIIIAARPSMGKTSLALQIARNVAANSSMPAGVFSLESSENDLTNRDISSLGDVKLDTWATLRGLTATKLKDVTEKMIEASPITNAIFYDTTTSLTPGRMFAKMRQLLALNGGNISAFFIDYIQKMAAGRKSEKGKSYSEENRNAELTYISNCIQNYVKILRVPIIVLSQLSRSGVDEPQLHHLRDSGSLEQDADIVLLLHNPGFYNGQDKTKCKVIVAKNKEGATGHFELGWNPQHANFYNLQASEVVSATHWASVEPEWENGTPF